MHMIRKGKLKELLFEKKHVLSSSTDCLDWQADQHFGIEMYRLSYFCTRTT